MHCCANCFGDSFLDRRIPELSAKIGNCDFCEQKGVTVVEPAKLLDYFQSISSIYSESDSSEAKLLVLWFKEDWQIFSSLTQIQAQSLLGEVLNDGEVVRKTHAPRIVQERAAVEKWQSFREEIIWKNRFFFQHELDLDRLKALFDTYLEADLSRFSNTIYRARIQSSNLVIPANQMGRPPADRAKNGRANPVGIPYLYAASSSDTAIAETRPHPGDLVSVARYTVIPSLRLLNLINPKKTISPFGVDDEDKLAALRYDLEFLCHLGSELSKPILPRVADLEYLPTQYLCEFIKNSGYDGVIFQSSISEGVNIALFDDSKVQVQEVSQYEVTQLRYENRQVPTH
jgi:hypothetical protein